MHVRVLCKQAYILTTSVNKVSSSFTYMNMCITMCIAWLVCNSQWYMYEPSILVVKYNSDDDLLQAGSLSEHGH